MPWSFTCFLLNVSLLLLWPKLPVARSGHSTAIILIYLLPVSRLIEIAYAFYNDSLDRISGKMVGLKLTKIDRLRLVGLSYVEVSVCYATLYLSLPADAFNVDVSRPFDALYFSWMTITTTGYGDILPRNTLARVCAMSEVGLGLLLLVVAVGAYFSYAERL